MVAQLDKLHADIDEDDAYDDGGHEEVACVAEFFNAEAFDVLADAGNCQCACDSAESEKPYGFTVLKEGRLLHAKGEASPQCQKGTEGESRTDAVNSCLGEPHKKFPDGF